MGFHTTFHIAYPGDPGKVTAASLRQLIEEMLPLCRPEGSWRSLSLKFGPNPSTSQRPFFWFIRTAVVGTAQVGVSQSDWDVQGYPNTNDELLSNLRSLDAKGIHRALLNFGALNDDVSAQLKRDPGPQNEIGLYPYDVGLQVGPIEVDPDDEDENLIQIGWAAFSISGNGYCYPWTHQQLIDRCIDTELCKKMRTAMLSIFGPPKDDKFIANLSTCSQRVRKLTDGLIAGVRGI